MSVKLRPQLLQKDGIDLVCYDNKQNFTEETQQE